MDTKLSSNGINQNLLNYFSDSDNFTTQDAYKAIEEAKLNVNKESIRARIYEGIEKGLFEKIGKGVYRIVKKQNEKETVCLLINGDGRDLSMIPDEKVDGIITDHPYLLKTSLKGGNRDFATYDLFRYEQKDFDEKMRVLKKGSFLVEFLPQETEENFEYLYNIKQMAIKAGFKYYAKVPWKKGTFVSNTGRCSKNSEDILFLTKGEPRALKLDAKKNIAEAKSNGFDVKGMSSYDVKDLLVNNGLEIHYMKGANGMLPTDFNYQPKNSKEKVMEAEKPVELIEAIINYISLPNELILDQFAGSHNVVLAALNSERKVITIEKDENIFKKGLENINNLLNQKYLIVE